MSTDTVLTDEQINEIDPDGLREGFARAIEQAVLQSPEIQALRKDAERYRWLSDRNGVNGSGVDIFIDDEAWAPCHLESQIDAAMERKT